MAAVASSVPAGAGGSSGGKNSSSLSSTVSSTTAPGSSGAQPQLSRQIPIVCPGHTRPLAELQFCPVPASASGDEVERCLLISACHDRIPMLRDGATGDWIGSLAGHKGAVWSAKLDPTASLAATASGDYSVKVWDAITGAEIYHFPHKHIVKSCDFSPNSLKLATGGHEAIIRVYDLVKPKEPPMEIPHHDASGGKVKVTKVVWRGDGTLITGGDDGKIRIWAVGAASPQPPPQVLGTDEATEIRDLEYVTTTQGREVLTVASGTKVYFFDLATKSRMCAYAMPIHFKDEGGASLHPGGEPRFIAGGSDLWVRVFDLATGRELECLKGHHGPIRCLRYAPDGRSFASGSEDGTIRLWKTSEMSA